ncbi:MAG: hypothetical protein H8E70_00110 [Candidatus Marinimicrobia bacterium]|nr:hypothetical protein [Candidatus Neomarinimicrobiota bacterium]
MNSTLSLIKLQDIDTQLLEISELLGDLPVKVDQLIEEEQQLKEDIDQRKSRIKEIELEISKKDLQVKSLTVKIDRLKDQLFLVKTNKQYDALSQEIDYLKEELNNIELNELELIEEKDTLSTESEKRENNLESLTEDLHKRKSNLESLIEESSEKKMNLESDRSDIVKELSGSVISKYDRVFVARDGLAVVETLGTSCGGCGSIVPPQKIAELKQGTTLQTCDVCSRFLFWPAKKD